MAYEPIDPTEVAAKQPLDTLLMGKVQADTVDSNARLTNLENHVINSVIDRVLLIFNGNFGMDSTGTLAGTTGSPQGWTFVAQTNGAGVIDQPADIEGANSFKFSSIGGGSNGGGVLTTQAFYAVDPSKNYGLRFTTYASVSGMYGSLVANYYDKNFNFVSSQTLWSLSGGYPTSKSVYEVYLNSPGGVGVCYVQFAIGGALVGSPAGSVWFFGFESFVYGDGSYQLDSISSGPQSGTFTVPNRCFGFKVTLVGRKVSSTNGGVCIGYSTSSPGATVGWAISSAGTVTVSSLSFTAQSGSDGGAASGGIINQALSNTGSASSIVFEAIF